MSGKCKCLHHGVIRVLAWVAWIAGILFVWAVFFNQSILNFNASYLFETIVVIGVLTYLCKYCSCCCNKCVGDDCNTCK